jgi:hypothetical protein
VRRTGLRQLQGGLSVRPHRESRRSRGDQVKRTSGARRTLQSKGCSLQQAQRSSPQKIALPSMSAWH